MAKATKTAADKSKGKKSNAKKSEGTAAKAATSSAGISSTSPSARNEKINPFLRWAPLLGLPIGALAAAEIWDWRGGTKWMLAIALFIIGWRFMLQVAHPNDPGAAS